MSPTTARERTKGSQESRTGEKDRVLVSDANLSDLALDLKLLRVLFVGRAAVAQLAPLALPEAVRRSVLYSHGSH